MAPSSVLATMVPRRWLMEAKTLPWYSVGPSAESFMMGSRTSGPACRQASRRDPGFRVAPGPPPHALPVQVQVQHPHAADDRLARFRVHEGAEGRVCLG